MKTVFLVTVALFLFSFTIVRGQSPYFKANVVGTVQTGVFISADDSRIAVAPLNNKRIFQEFAVSPQAYELVFDSSTFQLVLLPKHAGALPTISVFTLGGHFVGLNDTKAHVTHISAAITPTANTNLFKDLVGQVSLSRYFKGKPTDGLITKFVVNVLADSAPPTGSPIALLKFKVTTSGRFTQVP